MAWTHVQDSPEVSTTGTSITPTFPAASTGSAGTNHLITAELISNNAQAWNLPAGWVLGPDVNNSGAAHTTVAYLIDTAGGVTAVNFTCGVSANIKATISEFTAGAGMTLTLATSGTGTAAAVASCVAATAGTASAGDMAVCCFMEHFLAGTAIIWNNPAGFTLIASDQASSGGNHLYAGYDLSVGAGTVSVTGSSNTASTSTNGWAGAVAVFHAASAGATGQAGFVGANINPAAFDQSGLTMAQCITAWQSASYTGRFLAAHRIYYTAGNIPAGITTDLKADADAGRKVCMSMKPAFSPTTSADLDAINTFLSSCKAYGLTADVALWHEPEDNMTATQFIAMMRFYGPTVRQYYPLVYVTAAYPAQVGNATYPNGTAVPYYPGDAYVDKLATDVYANGYFGSPSITVSATEAVADGASPPKPFGIWEFNAATTGADASTTSQVNTFFGYIKSKMAGRLSAGKTNADVCYFNGSQVLNSPLTSPGDIRLPLYDAIFDSVNAVTVAAPNITTTSVPAATQGTAYSTTLAVTGGTAPYTWAVTSGVLPTGETLAGATGVVSGTPSVNGSFTVTVKVTDAAAATDTQVLTFTVAASATPLSVTTTTLPDATVGTAYSQALAAAGGSPPYTWALTPDALPAPLALSAGGTISGTPSTAGTSGFSVTVTDSLGATASAALFLTVDPAGGPAPIVSTPAAPASGWPQIYAELGMPASAPVSPPGTLILNDPVYGALGGGILGDATTWVDTAGFLRTATVDRPGSRVQGPLVTWQPGTASVVYDNSDGRFDPDNPAGPYVVGGVSGVRAMIPLRLRAVYASIAYPLYSGFTDGWADGGLTYDAGYAEMTATATDAFKILAGITLATTLAAGDGELTGARIHRILNAAAWYTDHRGIAAGASTVQATTLGADVLSLLQATTDTEADQLYVDGAGNLVFRGRHDILTDTRSAVPQAVFGDLPGNVATGGYTATYTASYPAAAGTAPTGELAYTAVSRANDDTPLANDVQATRVGGTLQEAADAVSQRTYLFPRTYSRTDLLHTADADTAGWAQWVLYVSKKADDRFESLTVDPLADPVNLWPQVLGREIGDRITVIRRPQNSGAVVTRDCYITGIHHDIDAVGGTWLTTWTLADATRYGPFLILNDPVFGALGSAALAY